VYCTVPRSLPCSVIVSAPVVASVTVSSEESDGESNVKASAFTCEAGVLPEISISTPRSFPTPPVDCSTHVMLESATQDVVWHAVFPIVAVAPGSEVPKLAPVIVKVPPPVVGEFVGSTELTVCCPLVRIGRIVSTITAAADAANTSFLLSRFLGCLPGCTEAPLTRL